ncbi:Flp pilus assembly protein CpaB [Lipingzhangella halophila]|uniref:Flp pilus assembly protein CpaB n=1 Tax=Lipingzhangella halophila TaxID=1783352 RepID=A0A7W7W614_9ACTN|nr:SAF domain-containing protein [Lipingzhangella halophila]MBB4934410.1 Flp pilus assembly protein CpaB [Lipingzhangella halophila]
MRPAKGASPGGGESSQLRLAAPRRQWMRHAGAAAVIALGAGIGVGWDALSQEERVPVVTAATDLPAGHVLGDDDIAVAHVTGMDSAHVVDAREADVAGQRLALPVAEGAPLSEGVLGSEAAFPGANEAVVAAALAPGALPASASEGSHVAIITDASGQAPQPGDENAGEPSQSSGDHGRAVDGRVHTIEKSEDAEPGVDAVVELVVSAGDAAHVARAAGEQTLRLVVVAEEGT